MCGLAGAVFAATDHTRKLERALQALGHRGPDGTHSWSGPDAHLGHTRLRILDTTTAADQPMVAQGGRGVLLYNGEVYNYRDLQRGLGQDWKPVTCCDTEVVLEMLVRNGPTALDQFNGMWALALWRPRERRLLLARDRFGVKPLFYAPLSSGGFAFASEIPALLQLLGRSSPPDMEIVERFLRFGEAEPRERTFFADVRKLPPGCYAEISVEGIRITKYWDLRAAMESADVPGDPVAAYREQLRDAVGLRLRSDVPVGTCLSGGLDSSSIVCTVERAAAAGDVEESLTYKAFSAVHPNTSADESPFIEEVLKATRFEGHRVVPSAQRLVEELGALVRHQAEPFGSLGVYSQWCVMRLAREHGVTVLLDGQGADEVLAGYPMYAHYRLGDLGRSGKVLEALREARLLSSVQGRPFASSLWSVAAGLVPAGLRGRRRAGLDVGADRFLTDGLRGSLSPAKLPGVCPDRFTDALYASVTEQGLPSLLRYEDRNSMAFSIEARVPFLDWRVVTLGMRLGAEWKLRDGWTKWILRESMAAELPPAIRWRRDKKAFSTPQADWLRGPLREWVHDLLSSRSFIERGWFEARAVLTEYERWRDGGGPPFDTVLWLLLSTELWARGVAEQAISPA
jgi:asparagine synthase (glutamine-hydrolysing)